MQNIYACMISQQEKSNQPTQPMIALGSLKQGIAGVAESLADARFLLNFQHLIDSHDPLFFDEISPIHQSTYNSERALAKAKESIIRALDQGSKNEIKSLIDKFISQLQFYFSSLISGQINVGALKSDAIVGDRHDIIVLLSQTGLKSNPDPGSWLQASEF